ncbi:RagB/SusD family nutrient uptake outer membrane protein [Longitalea arenae]|uniref:RagB/SusD family nutrient uptake outer membrane protein n=1 Tax=Longitalea arenae TaxID=2812558 RepID=UPI001967113D|nr:RagB/SusD family nutrient uptake outer membrane protein [Longitalea arenae]
MNKLKNLSYAVAAFLVTTATSCSKQLEEFNPGDATAENLWSTPTGFASLTATVYQDLHLWYGVEDGMWLLEGGTDLWYGSKRGSYARQYLHYDGLTSQQGQSRNLWQYAYRGINLCNAGIGRIDKAGFTNDIEKNQRLAELHFMRAFYNFQLVEQFGGVMLRTQETDESTELKAYRSSPEQFYEVIISDLEFAKNNLPVKWPAAEYSRADKRSAMGLLARVLLTRAYYATGGDRTTWFTKAKDAALEVINSKGSLQLDLYPTFKEACLAISAKPIALRAGNKEAMFVLAYNEENHAANMYTSGNPGGNRIFKYTITRYTGKPGFNNTYINAYGVDGEGRLMPTWHFLDLFNETIDSRYDACFQETWIANNSYTWTSADVGAARFDKNAKVVGKETKVGDVAMFLTKGDLPYNRKDTNIIAMGKSDLYVNPVHGQPAPIINNTVLTEYYPSFRKFVNPNRTATLTAATDYSDAYIMRFAEMYLIAAEAYTQLNDLGNAATMLNVIRRRAAKPGKETDMEVTAAQVNMDLILDERAREFAGEQHRWYDLKRVFRGQDWVNYIKKWNPDITLIQPHHWVRPIPQLELSALENAEEFGQNPNYQ